MQIAFKVTECERCHGQRIRTQACAECGAKPKEFETQPDLERRRKIVTEFRARPPVAGSSVLGFEEALSAAVALSPRMQGALAGVAKSGDSAHSLVKVFNELDELVATWTTRQMRPLTNRARIFGHALEDLRAGFLLFVDALEEPNFGEVQRRAQEGQKLLDRAGAHAGRLSESTEHLLRTELPVHEYVESLAADAVRKAGAPETIEELDRRLSAFSGRGAEGPTGVGIVAHIFGSIFMELLDLERSMQIVTEAERLLTSNAGLRSVLESSAWQKEQARVMALVSTAAFSLSAINEHSTDLETAKEALDMVVTCREGAIRHALATFSADDAAGYKRLLKSASGGLIKDAAERHPQLLLDENLDPVLRHAGAHVDFDIDTRGFVTTYQQREVVLTHDEFIDGVLGYMESAMAFLMAVQCHALELGIDMDDRHLSDRDRVTTLVMMGRLLGFESVRVEIDESTLRMDAEGDAANFNTLAAVGSTIATNQTVLLASLRSPNGLLECRADLEIRRGYKFDPDADEQGLFDAFAPIMASTVIDGESPWAEDQWATAAFVVGRPREGEPVIETARRIRRFKALLSDPPREDALKVCALRLQELLATDSLGNVPEAFRRAPK